YFHNCRVFFSYANITIFPNYVVLLTSKSRMAGGMIAVENPIRMVFALHNKYRYIYIGTQPESGSRPFSVCAVAQTEQVGTLFACDFCSFRKKTEKIAPSNL
ncbi:MAG: hypothetical protein RSC12_00135, partial [Alistipes sp.]